LLNLFFINSAIIFVFFHQGDSLLEMTIQWIAAACAQKELIYYCSGDAQLEHEIGIIVQEYSKKTAGEYFCISNS